MVPVLRAHPGILALAALVTLALLAASAAGVALAADAERRNRVRAAEGFAENTAVGVEAQLRQLMAPLLALAVFVREQPSVPHVAARFDAVARALLEELPSADARLVSLQLAPQGVVRLMYPLQGNEAAIGLDQLRDPSRRAASLETIRSDRLTLQGPMLLRQGYLGLIPRLPIFVPNTSDPGDTFGAADAAYDCGAPCYNAATGERFWGFASAIISFDAVARAPAGRGGSGGGGNGSGVAPPSATGGGNSSALMQSLKERVR